MMSGSEVAFFSLDRHNVDELDKERTGSAIRISRLLAKPHQLLATILIVNNLFNIAIILSLHLLTHKLLAGLAFHWHLLIEVVLITFVLVLFGEIIPKVYARHFNLKVARFMSLPISFFKLVFYPLVNVLVGSSALIENRFSEKISKIKADDVDQAIGMLNETHDNEKELLKRVVEFSNIMASEVMTNRTQVTYVKTSDTFETLHNTVLEKGFSRIPVCEEDLDDVIGFIYAKDLLKYDIQNPPERWQDLKRNPFFVLENTKIDKLLQQFKDNRQHIAIVVDEYGGSSGVVTLEDILEEVLGEIDDKYDIKNNEQSTLIKYRGKNAIVEGTISLLDLCKLLKRNFDEFNDWRGESDTLAGMLMEVKGDFLQLNEVITLGEYKFKVLSIDDKHQIGEVRIDKLNGEKITEHPPSIQQKSKEANLKSA